MSRIEDEISRKLDFSFLEVSSPVDHQQIVRDAEVWLNQRAGVHILWEPTDEDVATTGILPIVSVRDVDRVRSLTPRLRYSTDHDITRMFGKESDRVKLMEHLTIRVSPERRSVVSPEGNFEEIDVFPISLLLVEPKVLAERPDKPTLWGMEILFPIDSAPVVLNKDRVSYDFSLGRVLKHGYELESYRIANNSLLKRLADTLEDPGTIY